jgi:hypothetical protein
VSNRPLVGAERPIPSVDRARPPGWVAGLRTTARHHQRPRPPIAQRGKAKQKRTDLRLVGLGMVITWAGGIPLVWHAYPGNRPDVTQFPTLIDHLARRYAALPPAAAREPVAAVTGWAAVPVAVTRRR